MSLSYNEAIHIAETFANEIVQKYPNQILAVYAIGSLGSDYYRAGQSDIDTAIITNLPRNRIEAMTQEIEGIADTYYQTYHVPKGFGAIVFSEEQLYPPYNASEELILEILRLKVQSKPVWGHYDIEKVPVPTREALIEDAICFQTWLDQERKNGFVIDSPVRLVNSLLIILKRYLLLQQGIVEFNKFKVIDTYRNQNPPMINDKVLEYVDSWIHGEPIEVSEEEFQKMVVWYDELSDTINNLVLYKK